MTVKRIAVASVVFLVISCGAVSLAQQQDDPPTQDEIMAAQEQAKEAAAYQRSLEIEQQQQYAQQQRTLMQERQQQEQYAPQNYGTPEQQGTVDGRPRSRRPSQRSNYDPARQNYDPAAGPCATKPSWTNALNGATGHINPDDVNYGGLLSKWHMMIAQETIENTLFYGLLLELFVCVFSCLYIFHLRNERERRLQISGAVVTQIYNKFVIARNKAYKAIRAYNALVESKEEYLDALLHNGGSDIADSSPRASDPLLDISGKIVEQPKPELEMIRSAGDTTPIAADEKAISIASNSVNNSQQSTENIRLSTPDHGAGVSQPSGEIDALRRQVETLQSRLRSKNTRINELEDAIAVTSNTNKIPEL